MSQNVLGGMLKSCSQSPKTGYFRDGCCRTDETDRGRHVICVQVTREFLSFSRSKGNDLTTPVRQYGFPGLKPGDQWCLCATRWREALIAGVAPKVDLEATEKSALEIVSIEDLMAHALSSDKQ